MWGYILKGYSDSPDPETLRAATHDTTQLRNCVVSFSKINAMRRASTYLYRETRLFTFLADSNCTYSSLSLNTICGFTHQETQPWHKSTDSRMTNLMRRLVKMELTNMKQLHAGNGNSIDDIFYKCLHSGQTMMRIIVL